MKRLLTIITLLSLSLSGCLSNTDETTQEKLEEYETYYGIISDNTKFEQDSDNFNIALEMSQIPDGTYRYVIVVDEAKIAMYDIIMMAVEGTTPFEETTKMMPSLGIFEDESSLIPNQVNVEQGLAKGLAISGESKEGELDLQILVQYKNSKRTKNTREFFSYHLTTEGYEYVEINKELS